MALQKEKKERERELYLKTPKAQKFKLKKKMGDTKGWEAQKKMRKWQDVRKWRRKQRVFTPSLGNWKPARKPKAPRTKQRHPSVRMCHVATTCTAPPLCIKCDQNRIPRVTSEPKKKKKKKIHLLVVIITCRDDHRIGGRGAVDSKGVNTIPEAVPVWPAVRYISDISQYQCTVSGLPLVFYICK